MPLVEKSPMKWDEEKEMIFYVIFTQITYDLALIISLESWILFDNDFILTKFWLIFWYNIEARAMIEKARWLTLCVMIVDSQYIG